MRKVIRTMLLGVFLIAPVFLLVLYTINTARKESPKSANVTNLKLVTPVAIIDEIVQKIEEGAFEEALVKIQSELPDPNIPSSSGTPLTVLAAELDYTDIVATLIQKGADPNKADLNTSETALIKAVRNQNFDMLNVLLTAGADPNLGTNQGLTPLGLAIELRNEGLANHLLSNGATNGVNDANLMSYAFKKNPIGVGLMLSGGISPNVTDNENNTPIIISAANNDLESVKRLLSYRANINARNKHGMTALLYAVKGKHKEMVDYLINNGANINISNIYGQNALFWAAYYGDSELVHNLLMLGANYQKKTRRGQTALQMAKALGHTETVKMLEDFIAYKNLPRDSKGNIILPKVNQQDAASVSEQVSETIPEGEDNSVGNDIMAEVKQSQKQSTPQNDIKQNQGKDVSNQTQQNQAEIPQMPGGMDMSSLTSMMGGGKGGNMDQMIKTMQSMGAAGQTSSKTQQISNMPANVQMPAGMNMGDISKMIPAGTLPAGMDLNKLMSMNPEQLKKMGVPEAQISQITQAQQQTGQAQSSSASGLTPKDLSNTSSKTSRTKTQINKLQTSGNK